MMKEKQSKIILLLTLFCIAAVSLLFSDLQLSTQVVPFLSNEAKLLRSSGQANVDAATPPFAQTVEFGALMPTDHQRNDEIHQEREATSSHQHRKTHAVIHVGTLKTGTTSIQEESLKKKDQLRLDGYEMPWNNKNEANQRIKRYRWELGQNQINFAYCFRGNVEECCPCDPDLLLYGLDIAKRKKNLFVTSEFFSRMDIEGVKMLSAYLQNFDDVRIVIYYRRFYDWVESFQSQERRNMRSSGKLLASDVWESTIYETLVDMMKTASSKNPFPQFSIGTFYTVFMVRRLRTYFDDSNIVVMDYHDKSKGSPVESLYCHAMANATNTCKAIRDGPNYHKNKRVGKDKVDHMYGELTFGARKSGLIKITSEKMMNAVMHEARKHQEEILNLTTADFDKECPPKDVLDKLYELSLEYEKELFPSRFIDGSKDEALLQADFDVMSRTKLCKLDVKETLKQDTWKNFYKTLRTDQLDLDIAMPTRGLS